MIDETIALCKETSSDKMIKRLQSLNKHVIAYLRILHDDWIKSQNGIWSLIEANYFIDYYCTSIARMCMKEDEWKKTKISWASDTITYDKFKGFVSYQDGLTATKKLLTDIVNETLYLCKIHLPLTMQKSIQKTGNVIENWPEFLKYVPINTILRYIQNTMNTHVSYYASGWGMYRLINMYLLKGEEQMVQKPCSCICVSLIYISVMGILGFPKKFLYTHTQANKNSYNYRKKLTHWSVACENPFTGIKSKINNVMTSDVISIEDKNMGTTEGFALYTRDVIFYYSQLATKTFAKGPLPYPRKEIFYNLRDMFDAEFGLHLKTP